MRRRRLGEPKAASQRRYPPVAGVLVSPFRRFPLDERSGRAVPKRELDAADGERLARPGERFRIPSRVGVCVERVGGRSVFPSRSNRRDDRRDRRFVQRFRNRRRRFRVPTPDRDAKTDGRVAMVLGAMTSTERRDGRPVPSAAAYPSVSAPVSFRVDARLRRNGDVQAVIDAVADPFPNIAERIAKSPSVRAESADFGRSVPSGFRVFGADSPDSEPGEDGERRPTRFQLVERAERRDVGPRQIELGAPIEPRFGSGAASVFPLRVPREPKRKSRRERNLVV